MKKNVLPVNLTVAHAMDKATLATKVAAAEQYIYDHEALYSLIKLQILRLCVGYAKDKLVCRSINPLKPPANRYGIYSNIVNFSEYFKDNVHFLAFVLHEIDQIGPDESSGFRAAILPLAKRQLAIHLAPEVKKTRLAFAGLAGLGMSMLMVKPQIAFFCIVIGLAGVAGSEIIVQQRLKISLQTKILHLQNGQPDTPLVLNDGFEDVFSQFTRSTAGWLESGMNIFERSTGRLRQLTGAVQAPRVEALEDPRPSAPALDEGQKEVQLWPVEYYHQPPPTMVPRVAVMEEDEQKSDVQQRRPAYG